MSRAGRSVQSRRRRKATISRAKGYRGNANSKYRAAKQALLVTVSLAR